MLWLPLLSTADLRELRMGMKSREMEKRFELMSISASCLPLPDYKSLDAEPTLLH